PSLALGALPAPPRLAATLALPIGLPWLGAHFRLDALSAFFLVVVNLGGAAASLYGLGYGRHEEAPARVLPFFPAFLAAMNLVLVADDAFTFLFSWEFMSLASWALVMAHHRRSGNAAAGYLYLLMASFGTLALILAFGLLAGWSGAYDFAAIRNTSPSMLMGAAVLVLALAGAGSKAGVVPLHVWLPLAHPAAPSHVSALMSGVMTKVAVYGFVRIVFDLVGAPYWWWGALVALAGGITAVMGVLHALMEHDLKRLLGLIHRMPQTAFLFLVGSAGISALPPFNGFVSEWLTFQAILLSPALPQWLLKFLVPAIGALLALSAALAAACFVKAFGITFLGRPRSAVAREARETDRWSLAAMCTLAALCRVAGVPPAWFLDALAPVGQALAGAPLP